MLLTDLQAMGKNMKLVLDLEKLKDLHINL